MADEVLPAPAQLEAQLGKCKSTRPSTYYKSRVKSAAVSECCQPIDRPWSCVFLSSLSTYCEFFLIPEFFSIPICFVQEIKEAQAKREAA